jgi:hypothetical protein
MRRVLKALLILIIGIPVLAALAYGYLQQQLQQAGVNELKFDVKRFTLTNLQLQQLQFSLEQPGSRQQIAFNNVDIHWQWPQWFKPQLMQLSIGSGQIQLDSTATLEQSNTSTALILPATWQLPAWLPEHIAVSNTTLLLPCPAGHCPVTLNGVVRYTDTADTVNQSDTASNQHNLSITQPDSHRMWQSQLSISSAVTAAAAVNELLLNVSYQATPQPLLSLTLQQDQQLGLSLKQQLNLSNNNAVTELAVALSPPTTANQALLQRFGIPLPASWLAQFQQPVQFYSKLSWQIPADGDLASLLTSHDIEAIAIIRAPDPFFLPQLGLIQGQLNAELSLKNQQVERWQLTGNGILTDIALPPAISAYGLALNPVQIVLSSAATKPLSLSALPLQMQLSSTGNTAFTLNSQLQLNLSAAPKLMINMATLIASIGQWQLPEPAVKLMDLKLNSNFSGYWQADHWQLQLADNSLITSAIKTEAVSTAGVTLRLNNSHLNGDQDGLTELNSDLHATVSDLRQETLISQNWQWQGLLTGSLQNLNVNGQLSNTAGLNILHQLTYQPATSALALTWQLTDIFMLAGNPLSTTFTGWPPLLSLTTGKLAANGSVNLTPADVSSSNQLLLGDIGGIYDRSLFAGLNATIDITLNDNLLQLQSNDLMVNRLNHGFELGPLSLSATTLLPLAAPEQTTLTLHRAELQVMQGLISANNQKLNFNQAENQLILTLQQIDLASLLQQHPSHDLTGNGKLSGTVPLAISAKGLSITNGNIAAEKPGGLLQYRSESTKAMASTNSNMKLVFDALDNFQYSVLSSKVSYDTNGKLLLGLSLQGSNPNMQQGRTINLNVNLEEDLPALITSLQLTNKLNELITKRVQQYLKQQQAAAAVNGDQ